MVTFAVIMYLPDMPEESGEIHLVFDFQGPAGVAYPQYQPNVDSYDERNRINLPDANRPTMADQKLSKERSPKKDLPRYVALGLVLPCRCYGALFRHAAETYLPMNHADRSNEFTDEELQEAFKFVDLDKNNFVGAAEIRHILVCMGELVTDEEIDAMIALVDGDGDG